MLDIHIVVATQENHYSSVIPLLHKHQAHARKGAIAEEDCCGCGGRCFSRVQGLGKQ